MNRRSDKNGRPRELFLVFVLLTLAAQAGESTARKSSVAAPPASDAKPMPLSSEGKASLHAIIAAGTLPDLRWPDFSDYRQHLTDFYVEYDYALPWVHQSQPTPQARQAIALFLKAEQKGLSAEDYDASRWEARLAKLRPAAPSPSETDALRFDLALTISLMRYISDLHIGKINPRHFDFGLDIEQKKYDLPEFLQENVVEAPDIEQVLLQVEPPYPGYRRSLLALQKYRELALQDDGERLPEPAKTIAPGEPYAGIPRLARFLRLVGDLPAAAEIPADARIYSGPVVDAVKIFQARHGLDADGKLDAKTVAEMNVPLSKRVRQMELTLERWRWLPLGEAQPLIVVNIPEFHLRAYDEHLKRALAMNVVVGKAYDHSTPIFTDEMEYVIFRPFWNVPPSIANKEIIPAIQKNPNYLSKENLEIVDARGNVVASEKVPPEMIPQIRSGKLIVRQKPGPKNSLGLAKFIFPNSYDVYLHDTPATQFFARSRRDFSHGCIRLEKPADLAAWVLRNNPGWTPEHIHSVMYGDSTVQVNLKQPLAVLIIYATVVVSEDGVVHFYDDIYGHDTALEQALLKGYPYPG